MLLSSPVVAELERREDERRDAGRLADLFDVERLERPVDRAEELLRAVDFLAVLLRAVDFRPELLLPLLLRSAIAASSSPRSLEVR
jgi:hypothetical protein